MPSPQHSIRICHFLPYRLKFHIPGSTRPFSTAALAGIDGSLTSEKRLGLLFLWPSSLFWGYSYLSCLSERGRAPSKGRREIGSIERSGFVLLERRDGYYASPSIGNGTSFLIRPSLRCAYLPPIKRYRSFDDQYWRFEHSRSATTTNYLPRDYSFDDGKCRFDEERSNKKSTSSRC